MNEWRERANRRRDERQQKVPAIRSPSGSKKDTKKWCRGVVGREHKPVCVDYSTLKNVNYGKTWKNLICSECNKQLDYYWPASWGDKPPPPPPDWVS